MKNQWIASEEYFASWEYQLPYVPPHQRLDWALAFIERFLAIGKEEQVWQLLQAGAIADYPGFPIEPLQSYVDYIRGAAKFTSNIYFLPTVLEITSSPHDRHRMPANVSYFDNGAVVEGKIENIGELARQVYHDHPLISVYSANIPPITTLGAIIPLEEEYNIDRADITFNLNLQTDIWFPKVFGYLNNEIKSDPFTCNYENALAAYHTPRLNNFISKLHQLISGMGGHWDVTGPLAYAKMVHKDGIDLN